MGVPVTLVKEPGGTAVGQVTRRLLKHRLDVKINPLAELFLFAAARAQLVGEIIRPALEQNQMVICDRYAESTLAYQGYGRGMDLKVIETVNSIATGGLRPDLIILLDMDVSEGLHRKGSMAIGDRFEREDISFHRRVRQGYLEMAKADPGRWLLIDAARSRREIGELIWERVRMYCPGGNLLDR